LHEYLDAQEDLFIAYALFCSLNIFDNAHSQRRRKPVRDLVWFSEYYGSSVRRTVLRTIPRDSQTFNVRL